MKKLSAKNLSKTFNKEHLAVDNVSFEVNQGEIVGLLGPNGAGKTTSFYMAIGLLYPDQGEIFLNDENITHLPMHQRSRLGMGYLPQEPSVFQNLSVYDNIFGVLEIQGLSSKLCRERTEAILGDFSLTAVAKSLGTVLSGGERRRVEIARALALSPDFLLLDEPFAGIDPIAMSDIQNLISMLQARGVGVLITDHNVRETLKICNSAYILISGKIEASGSPDTVAKSSIARDNYLGKDFQF